MGLRCTQVELHGPRISLPFIAFHCLSLPFIAFHCLFDHSVAILIYEIPRKQLVCICQGKTTKT
jgi:hypothetical protein